MFIVALFSVAELRGQPRWHQQTGQESSVCAHNGTLHNHKEEWDYAIFRSVDRPEALSSFPQYQKPFSVCSLPRVGKSVLPPAHILIMESTCLPFHFPGHPAAFCLPRNSPERDKSCPSVKWGSLVGWFFLLIQNRAARLDCEFPSGA